MLCPIIRPFERNLDICFIKQMRVAGLYELNIIKQMRVAGLYELNKSHV